MRTRLFEQGIRNLEGDSLLACDRFDHVKHFMRGRIEVSFEKVMIFDPSRRVVELFEHLIIAGALGVTGGLWFCHGDRCGLFLLGPIELGRRANLCSHGI
jgi:hypothetical protein